MPNKTRVLIVDDNDLFSSSLSDIFLMKGYESAIANSGEAALNKVKDNHFDVILMDIKLPGINGVETAKKIKLMNPKIVVIMMTAYAAEDLVQDALKEGVCGIVYKPLDIDKTINMIEECKFPRS